MAGALYTKYRVSHDEFGMAELTPDFAPTNDRHLAFKHKSRVWGGGRLDKGAHMALFRFMAFISFFFFSFFPPSCRWSFRHLDSTREKFEHSSLKQ